jgi:GDP-L-fucose synthase
LSGVEHSIKQVAEIIKTKVGFDGVIEFNSAYPNGTPRKLMDVSKINNLGWEHHISFEKGIEMVIDILAAELQKYE